MVFVPVYAFEQHGLPVYENLSVLALHGAEAHFKWGVHFYSGGRFKFEQESVEVWRFRAPLPDARNAREIPFADGEFF